MSGQRISVWFGLSASIAGGVLSVGVLGFLIGRGPSPAKEADAEATLRVQRLEIVDSKGRPRIVLSVDEKDADLLGIESAMIEILAMPPQKGSVISLSQMDANGFLTIRNGTNHGPILQLYACEAWPAVNGRPAKDAKVGIELRKSDLGLIFEPVWASRYPGSGVP